MSVRVDASHSQPRRDAGIARRHRHRVGRAARLLLAVPPPRRWLLAFGYYIVFEFCAISRGYALGILFALAACAAARRAPPADRG